MKDKSLSSILPHLRDKFFKVSLSPQNTIRWECPVCKNVIVRRVSEKTLYSFFVCSYCKHKIEF